MVFARSFSVFVILLVPVGVSAALQEVTQDLSVITSQLGHALKNISAYSVTMQVTNEVPQRLGAEGIVPGAVTVIDQLGSDGARRATVRDDKGKVFIEHWRPSVPANDRPRSADEHLTGATAQYDDLLDPLIKNLRLSDYLLDPRYANAWRIRENSNDIMTLEFVRPDDSDDRVASGSFTITVSARPEEGFRPISVELQSPAKSPNATNKRIEYRNARIAGDTWVPIGATTTKTYPIPRNRATDSKSVTHVGVAEAESSWSVGDDSNVIVEPPLTPLEMKKGGEVTVRRDGGITWEAVPERVR